MENNRKLASAVLITEKFALESFIAGNRKRGLGIQRKNRKHFIAFVDELFGGRMISYWFNTVFKE
jgi:hypothetical protein